MSKPDKSEVVEESPGLKNIGDKMVCARCLDRARRGWCYKVGSIQLITCDKPACQPTDPNWFHALDFK